MKQREDKHYPMISSREIPLCVPFVFFPVKVGQCTMFFV